MRTFNLVKSLTRVINNYKGLLILCLSLATFGVNDAWGKAERSWSASVAVGSGKGSVKAVIYKHNVLGGKDEEKTATATDATIKTASASASATLVSSISNRSCQYFVNSADAGYSWDGWYTNAACTSLKTKEQSFEAWSKTTDNKNVTFYAKFTPSSAVVTTNDGVTAQDPATSVSGSVVFTVSNADELADFKKPGSITTISGIGSFSVGEWSYSDGKITINYTYTPNNTSKETRGELKLVSAGGENTCTATITGKANKHTATMSWKTGTNVMNVGDIFTTEALNYSDDVRPIVFTTSDATIIKINDDGYPEAVSEGKTTITATQAETAEFYETKAAQEITVTNKQKQLIEWTDKLSFKYEDSQFTQTLTASAHTNITYSLSDVTNSCVSLSGNVLTIKNYGTAYVTATAAETDEYIGVSMTRKVIIRDPSAACETIIYGPSAEHEFDLGWNAASHKTLTSEIDLGGQEPRFVNFDYRGKVHTVWPVDYYTGELQLYQYVNGGWSLVKNFGKPDKNNYANSGNLNLDRKATKIQIRANDGMGYMYYKDLVVVLAKYLEVSTDALSFDGQVGISATNTFDVNYSDVQGPIEITSSNSDIFTFSPSSIEADCEQHGTVKVTVTLNSKKEINTLSETITISNGVEPAQTITVSGKVTKRKQDINWSDATTYNSTDKPTLSATATSGLAISSYSSSNENIAKVVNGSQLEFYSSGKVNITAHQDGDDYYEPASLTKEFTINKVTPTISTKPTATAITYGQKLSESSLASGAAKVNPFRGEAVDHPVTGSFAWTNGEYTIVEAGGTHEYDVTFTPSGTEAGMYNTVSGKATVTINKATPTLTAKNEDDLEVFVNDTQTPKLNLVDYITEYSAADDTHGHVQAKSAITFACNQNGAVIEGNKFYATKAGTYTITATAPATDYYNSQTTTFTIKAINYYYSQAKSIVATNTTTGKDGGWVSVWQNSKDSATIGDGSWLHEDQTSNYKRLTGTTHPYYFRAKVGTGYTFAGWFTSAEATVPEYTKPTYDANFTVTNRDRENSWITRYAKFTPITYTVTFVGNGNTGGSMSDQTFTYDVAQNLTANGFTRTGWSFTGWKDGNGNTYTNEQSVSNLASIKGAVVTMTTQWSQDVYTVTLDPDPYGTGGTAQISVKYNELIPTSITPPTPIDPAYIFLGYYDGDTQYYNADGTAVSGKKWPFTEGKTLTAKWQTGDYIKSWDVADSYTAQSNIPYDIAKSFSGAPVTYSIEGTDEGVITINNASKYIYANKKGKVMIMACPVLSEGYSSVTPDTHEITVVGKEQKISWSQSFTFTTQQDGSIDETVALTAKAIDASTGVETGNSVWYSVGNSEMAEILGNASTGYSLHVKLYGTGSTTITAHVDGTEVYESGELKFNIRIYKYGDKCHVDVMIYPIEEQLGLESILTSYKEEVTITKDRFTGAPTDSLYVQIMRNRNASGHLYISAYAGTDAALSVDYTDGDVNIDYQTYGFNLSLENVDNVKFASKSAFPYIIKDVRVTQKSYLRTDIAHVGQYYPIEAGIYVNDYYSKQFTISYSAKHQVMWQITNTSKKDDWNLRIVGHTKCNQSTADYTNDCADWGTYTFELSTTHVWLTQEDIKDTITIKTSDGNDAIVIPVRLTVGLGAIYQFAADKDNEWNTLQNWHKEGSSESVTSLPDMRNKVEIYAPVRITEPVTVYGLTIKENTATKGSVTIAPTGGLTVYNGGVVNLDYALTIESSQENQGFFRMSPDASTTMTPMPIATTQLATRSTLDEGANDDAVWQYIGTPAKTYDPSSRTLKDGLEFTVDYITWLYEWSEPNGWVDMKNVPQPVMLKPFTGYAITQYGQPIYEFTGRFLHDNVRIPLTCTDEPGMLGDNVIANSYTSPIDVTLVDQTDFEGGNVIQAFYVFNSGSYNQWKEQNKEGDGRGKQSGSLNNYTPGQYIAIPTKSGAALGENELTMIAPMQGFDIYATEKGKTAYFNLNYRKHVWNATNARGQMNQPLRAPKADDTYMPDDVARQYAIWDSINAAKQARIDAITHRVRLIAYGENSGNDRVVIIESPLYAKQYENGADAPKMFAETDGLLGLYTNEQDCGLMSVNATNSVDGMFVGFRAGSDSEYELSASNVIGQPLRLIDLQTQQMIDLKDSATYTFTAEPNSQDDFRFQIINQDIHVNPTGWGGLGAKAKIWYYKQTLYVSDAAANSTAAIYTADGVTLKQVTFNHNTTISTADMPEGVYTVRVEDSVLKVFVKH